MRLIDRLVETGVPPETAKQFVEAAQREAEAATMERDTDGDQVPTWKAHAYTYDGAGNLATDTVTDGETTWVRTFMWNGGAQMSDSGWVKQ